jgi:hypothetical protein
VVATFRPLVTFKTARSAAKYTSKHEQEDRR